MPNHGKRVTAAYLKGMPPDVAQRLLGQQLVRMDAGQRLSCRIVEVEAYLAHGDLASHSACGQTKRNATMFAPRGHLYVYTIHTRCCLNIVVESSGVGSAILIRAAEPMEGVAHMARNRRLEWSVQEPDRRVLRSLGSGPGRLCESLNIDRSLDGIDLLTSNEVWLERMPDHNFNVQVTPRIGISKAKELRLRYFLDGHAVVSGLARAHSRPRRHLFAT